MERNNKPTKNLFLMKFTGVLIQIVLIVISVVLTFLMTQLYYDRNVRYQVKVDASKELFLRQLQIYNSVQTLCQLDSLYAIKTKAILLDQQTYMYNDQFGNKIKIKEEIDQTSKRQKDTIMVLPSFVCNNIQYDKFNQQIEFIRNNYYLLEPAAYRYCDSLISFIKEHPLPNSRANRSVVLSSVWSRSDVQKQYFYLLEELFNVLKVRVCLYLDNEQI